MGAACRALGMRRPNDIEGGIAEVTAIRREGAVEPIGTQTQMQDSACFEADRARWSWVALRAYAQQVHGGACG